MRARIETVEDGIVMSHDLLEGECRRVGGGMAIGGQDDIEAETHGAANGCVDAVLGLASADDELLDMSCPEFGFERGLEESVASAFVNDQVTWMRRYLRANLPAWSILLQSVARAAVVLNIDDRHRGCTGLVKKLGNTHHGGIESLIDLVLANEIGKGEDAALNVDDDDGGLDRAHGSE